MQLPHGPPRLGGTFILRVEDTDAQRSDASHEEGIYEGLRWLGLDWDEGPNVGGPFGPYRQSERQDIHGDAVQQLLATERAYYDYTTADERAAEREEQRAEGRPQRYSGLGRHFTSAEIAERKAAGVVPAVRFRDRPEASSVRRHRPRNHPRRSRRSRRLRDRARRWVSALQHGGRGR